MIKVDKWETALEGRASILISEIGVAVRSLLECITKDEDDPVKVAQSAAPMIMTSILLAFDMTEEKIGAPLFPKLGYIGEGKKKPKLDNEVKQEIKKFIQEILKEDD